MPQITPIYHTYIGSAWDAFTTRRVPLVFNWLIFVFAETIGLPAVIFETIGILCFCLVRHAVMSRDLRRCLKKHISVGDLWWNDCVALLTLSFQRSGNFWGSGAVHVVEELSSNNKHPMRKTNFIPMLVWPRGCETTEVNIKEQSTSTCSRGFPLVATSYCLKISPGGYVVFFFKKFEKKKPPCYIHQSFR